MLSTLTQGAEGSQAASPRVQIKLIFLVLLMFVSTRSLSFRMVSYQTSQLQAQAKRKGKEEMTSRYVIESRAEYDEAAKKRLGTSRLSVFLRTTLGRIGYSIWDGACSPNRHRRALNYSYFSVTFAFAAVLWRQSHSCDLLSLPFFVFQTCSLQLPSHDAQDNSSAVEPVAALIQSSAVWPNKPPNRPKLPDCLVEPAEK